MLVSHAMQGWSPKSIRAVTGAEHGSGTQPPEGLETLSRVIVWYNHAASLGETPLAKQAEVPFPRTIVLVPSGTCRCSDQNNSFPIETPAALF